MEKESKENFIKLIKVGILLIPMSFLFHYIETSLIKYGSIFAFIGTFIFIVLSGLVSTKIKAKFIILINLLSILLSIVLGKIFITAPNESWFNPFGMGFAIVFVGIIILFGILIVRSFASRVF